MLDKTDVDSCTNTGAKNNYICNGSDKSVVFNFIQKKISNSFLIYYNE